MIAISRTIFTHTQKLFILYSAPLQCLVKTIVKRLHFKTNQQISTVYSVQSDSDVYVWRVQWIFTTGPRDLSAGMSPFSQGMDTWDLSAGICPLSQGMDTWDLSAGMSPFSQGMDTRDLSAGMSPLSQGMDTWDLSARVSPFSQGMDASRLTPSRQSRG